jgi:uncharacterized protein
VSLTLLLLGSCLIGEIVVRFRRKPSPFQPAAPAREVALNAADGLAIAATYWPGARPDAPAVLLLHGVYDSRVDLAQHAEWLVKQGFAALAIDFRGHGRSDSAPHSFGLNESHDARAAFNWLTTQQQGAPVGVLGVSLGGAAALLGDEGPLPGASLVLQAVYPDIRRATRNRIAAFLSPPVARLLEPLLSYQSIVRFGVWPERLTPKQALAAYDGPVFIIGGGMDRFTPPAETREMFDAAPGWKRLLLLDGLDHDEASHIWSDDYRTALLHFFHSTLGVP